MKCVVVSILIVNCLFSYAQNTNDSELFKTCDPEMNHQREELGEKLIEKSDFQKAAQLILPCAEAGDPFYQFSLGLYYGNDDYEIMTGMKINYEEALKWIEKAAEQDYEDAILVLMEVYESGELGLQKDPEKYAYWSQRLIEAKKITD